MLAAQWGNVQLRQGDTPYQVTRALRTQCIAVGQRVTKVFLTCVWVTLN